MVTNKLLLSVGKVKALGLSMVTSSTLRRAYKVAPIDAVQVEYSPWSLEIEDESGTDLLQACRELGVTVVAYSPLGRGFLTGRYKSHADFEASDFRRTVPRYSEENFPKNLEIVDKFQEMAKAKGCTASQLVLAWVLAQGDDFIPIPGTKSIKYVEENVGALSVKVTPEDDREIRRLVKKTVGSRASQVMMALDMLGDTPELS